MNPNGNGKYPFSIMTQTALQVDGVDVMGVCNCNHLFNPDSDWPDRQDWDGITPPWLDQGGTLDEELSRMFR
jgi:hypothetical protein